MSVSRRELLRAGAGLAGGIALSGYDLTLRRSAAAWGAHSSAAEDLRVYLIWIDSLRPDEVNSMLTPTIWGLRQAGTWYESVSVLPSSSTQNTAAMLTGALPQDNGFPWNPVTYTPPHAQEFRVNHLFTRLANEKGRYERGAVKTFYFSNTRDDANGMFNTGSETPPAGGRVPNPFASALAESATAGPQFGFIQLGEPDAVGHTILTPEPGQSLLEAARAARTLAIREIDLQLGQFISDLDDDAWSRTVLLVVSDHGMELVTPIVPVDTPAGGWINVDGALIQAGYNPPDTGEQLRDYNIPSDPDGSVFIDAVDDAEIDRMADVLRETKGVALVVTRSSPLSLDDLGVDMEKYPAYHSDILAFAAEGYTFNPVFSGIHGHPLAQPNVLMVAGGHPWLTRRKGRSIVGFEKPTAAKPADPVGRPSVLSIAPTIAWLFGLGRRPYYENRRLIEAFDRDA